MNSRFKLVGAMSCVALFLSCFVDSADVTGKRCDEARPCPSPFVCALGTCQPEGTPAPDASAADAATAVPVDAGEAADATAATPADAEVTPVDAAMVPPDAATIAPDAATVAPDAATIASDAAVIAPDASQVRPDAAIAASPDAGPGWYADWQYRQRIVVDHTQVGAAGTDYPLLVTAVANAWKSAANGGHIASNQGWDLVFTAADGATKLDHELDYYDPVSGELWCWVRLPSLSASADTVLFVYYGKPASGDQQNVHAVWSTAFRAVWHLGEATGTAVKDSTTNANLGTKTSATEPSPTGGGAQVFDGVNDCITVPASSSLNQFPNGFTVSLWMSLTAAPGGTTFSHWTGYNGYGLWNDYLWYSGDGTNWVDVGAGLVFDGNWHQYVLTWDKTVMSSYVDGAFQGSKAAATLQMISSTTAIGCDCRTSMNDYGKATIDEVRVLGVVRSAAEIATEYRNIGTADLFMHLDPEEQHP